MEINSRRQFLAALDRWPVRIDAGHPIAANREGNSELRPISAANIQDSKLASLAPRKLPLDGPVHKTKTLPVSP
jgi:hypothetical protein